jgi:competence protein ComEC
MVHYSLNKNEKVNYPFDLPVIKDAYLFGKVVDVNLMRPDRIIFYLSVDSIQSVEKHFKGKIQLLSTVKDSTHNLDGFYQKIAIGNYVKAKGTITRARDNRNPGEFDYESTLTEAGINGLLVIYRVSDIKIISDQKDFQKNAAFDLRKSIDEVIRKYHNSSTTSLLRGLLLADKSMINFETKVDFINAGVIHVLAVSGLHVGFIVLIFVFLFKRLNPYFRYGFTIIGLLLFVVITNYPTSVLRASIMSVALVISPLTGRGYNSMNSLALAALIILLLNPVDLFDPGFLLSFSAVIAIVTLYPLMARKINGWKIKSGIVKYLLLFFSVSLAAQIGTLPFTLLYFHKLSLVALIANLIVIPLIGFIVGLGIMTLIAGSVFYYLGIAYASANELLSFLLFSFVRLMGRYEYAFISIQKFSLFDSVLFYSAAFLIALIWKRLTNWKTKLIVSLLTVIILFTGFKIDDKDLMPDNKLSVLTVDVGQGDAILIKFPYGKTALIDGGNATEFFDNGERILIPLLNFLGIDKIDYGFITHADADHYKGYLTLIEQERIKQIFKPLPDYSIESDYELESAIKNFNVPVKYFGKSFLRIDGVRLYILNDTTNYNYRSLSMNDRSGVIKLVYGNTSFLLTGDSGIKAENHYLNKYGRFLKSNVLKAGHHGSKTSSSEIFIDTVKPDYAVISVGIVNRFNHPSPEIIDRFNSRGIKILRTDHSGGILLQSDGRAIKNINWKKE